jgi:hypothetical protein
MLNPAALLLLSTLPAGRLPLALRLFADYDLSVPRLLNPELLDSRYEWKPGTAYRLLCSLLDAGLLTGSRMLRLAPEYCWKPSDLAEQWTKMERTGQREQMAC